MSGLGLGLPATTGDGLSAITETWEFCFYPALGGLSAQVPYPYSIAIDGRPFEIDLARYAWEIPDMVRQSFDFSARPGEGSLDTGGVWLRASGDWSLGAGQTYLDASDSQARMFSTSLGIDPWTPRELSLLPATESLVAAAHATLKYVPVGTYLYMMDGEGRTLKRTANPQAASPTITPITGGPAADFYDATTDGTNVYLATNGAIYTSAISGTSMTAYGTTASTTTATLLRYASGWLLCGVANVLSSIDAAGALTTVKTHPSTGFTWAAVVGTPQGIYAGGQSNDLAEIYVIGIDSTTGGLSIPVHAGELPRGETLKSLTYYSSTVLIGTSKGLRLATILSGGGLDIGPLIDTGGSVLAAFGEAQFVWFGWTNYDATHTGTGRAKLSEFTAPNTPAYATDIMYVGQGSISSVCRFAGHTYFAVGGTGFYREQYQGNLVASATIRMGRLEWGLFVPKTFLGAEVSTDPLDGTVDVTVYDDQGNSAAVGTLSAADSTGLGTVLLGGSGGSLSTYFDIQLDFTRSATATLGPVVRLVTARALPSPKQIQRWTLPIIVADHIRTGFDARIEQSMSPFDTQEFFIALRDAGAPVTFQLGQDSHVVTVRRVAFEAGLVTNWAEGREGLQGTMTVVLDGVGAN